MYDNEFIDFVDEAFSDVFTEEMKNADDFRKKLVVEGKSFNEPVLVNGKEDFARSRRVELKIKVKNWNVSKALGLRK